MIGSCKNLQNLLIRLGMWVGGLVLQEIGTGAAEDSWSCDWMDTTGSISFSTKRIKLFIQSVLEGVERRHRMEAKHR
jgi:hypothetical protein